MPAWQYRDTTVPLGQILLDQNNPRLVRASKGASENDLIRHLFTHTNALKVAQVLSAVGHYPMERTLVVKQGTKHVVMEGNRRIAALKAMRDPEILKGTKHYARIFKMNKDRLRSLFLRGVPVTVAATRQHAQDIIIARHTQNTFQAWSQANRADYLLNEVSDEGDVERLVRLGVSKAEIQEALRTRSIAQMIERVPMDEIKRDELVSQASKKFTTVVRLFDMPEIRAKFQVAKHDEHGFVLHTTKKQAQTALAKLFTEVADGDLSSRNANKVSQAKDYFKSEWSEDEFPSKSTRTLRVDQLGEVSSSAGSADTPKPKKKSPAGKSRGSRVVPKQFKIKQSDSRKLDQIFRELRTINPKSYPNAGAMLLRTFFELSILDYLDRTGRLDEMVAELEAKGSKHVRYGMKHGLPVMSKLKDEIETNVVPRLKARQQRAVRKVLNDDPYRSGNSEELNSFIHCMKELPTDQALISFWDLAEPLFELMLVEPHEESSP
ncbi:MAG: hypothetical protein NXI14_05915 [bacterium]|nr:hypothetical protein [bacterium]